MTRKRISPTIRPCCGVLWEEEHKPDCQYFLDQLKETGQGSKGASAAAPTAILCGDIHLTPKAPVCREQAEWEKAILRKLEFITEQGWKYDCPILCSGDLTHRWYADRGEQGFWAQVVGIMRQGQWYVVPGNHDLPNHSLERLEESLLWMLYKARACEVWLDSAIGGNLWGQEIQAVPWGMPPEPTGAEVVIIHKLVYQGKPPFPGAEKEGATAKALMKQFPDTKLILTGDNHQTFTEAVVGVDAKSMIVQETKQLLVNPGSMMRMTAAQVDHKPSVFLWYAESNMVQQVFLPIEEGVVNRDHIDNQEQHDARITAFVERLHGEIDIGASFEENLKRYMADNNIAEPVQALVREALGG